MKKLVIAFTVAVLFFTASSFAKGIDEIPGKVKSSFEKNFNAASNANWTKNDQLYFVNFSWNTTDVQAVFNADGELLSTSRKLENAQLPLKISLQVEKKYKGFHIKGSAVEIIADDQTTYNFAITNDTETVNLTSDAFGELTEKK